MASLGTEKHQEVLWKLGNLHMGEEMRGEMEWLSLSATAKSLQSCPTLCNPIDGSPPSSPVPGILQARPLEWVAISFSNAWKRKVKVKLLSRVRLLATPWTAVHQASPSMGFSRQEYWSGLLFPSPKPKTTQKNPTDFPGGTVNRNLPANAEDMGSIYGPGRYQVPRSNWVHMPQPLKPMYPRARALKQKKPLLRATREKLPWSSDYPVQTKNE